MSVKTGDIFNTNNCGRVRVINFANSKEIKVQFEDGTVVTTQLVNVRNGCVMGV